MSDINSQLILLATYWNEIDWIKPSLEQIDLINPTEAIICDGCFDPEYPIHSTDGTYEIIQDYVDNRSNAQFISPARVSRLNALTEMFKFYNYQNHLQKLYLSRLKNLVRTSRMHLYRVNQALTFNRMIHLSYKWSIGKWFMTYDCDQFYSDRIIDNLHYLHHFENYDLLTAKELTFIDSFDFYTTLFEHRTWNNMPHRIHYNTFIAPTRIIFLENPIKRSLYINTVKYKNLDYYFHYKFKSSTRQEHTYLVGDRSSENKSNMNHYKYKTCKLHHNHPHIIQKYMSQLQKICSDSDKK